MESGEGGGDDDDGAFPFHIHHSEDGIEVVQRREQRQPPVAEAAYDAGAAEDHDGVGFGRVEPFLHDWEPWNRRARREGGDDDEQAGYEGEEGDRGFGAGGEFDEVELGHSSEFSGSVSSEEMEREVRRMVKKAPASPRSPRGGYDLMNRWNGKLKLLADEIRELEPEAGRSRMGPAGRKKKKREEVERVELPALEQLEAKVRRAELVNKEHAIRSKVRELSRLREHFREGLLDMHKIRM